MDFLRRHVFLIGCGVACAVGIALGVTGLKAMPKVQEEMKKVETLYRNLENLQSQAVNQDRIDAEKQRIDLVVEDRDNVMTRARTLYGNVLEKVAENGKESYRYKLLVPEVFPNGEQELRFEFRDKYAAAMEKLLGSLNYGGPAIPSEVATWRDTIDNEHAAEKEYGLDPGAPQSLPVPSGPERTPAGVLTKAGARDDARARADIAAAQRIYCYAVHFNDETPPSRVMSLHFEPAMKDTGTVDAPELEDVWRAQVGYWVQKDVVDAIVAINNEAAEEARRKGENGWIGIMPVKEVISIRVMPDYVPPLGEGETYAPAAPGGYEEALSPGTAESVFTGTAPSASYEVVQSTVKLVMDQRDIPRLVDSICKNSFHTLLGVSYEAVPPNRKMVGKIYGSEPTVNVVMDFETVMLGEVFRRLMPQVVIEYYDIRCREIDECPKIEED